MPQVENRENTPCFHCSEECESQHMVESQSGRMYCGDCYSDLFVICGDCGEEMATDESYNYNDLTLCRYHYDLAMESDDASWSVPGRDWSAERLRQFMSVDQGEIIASSRIFSAEIEAYDDERNIESIAADLPRPFGVSGDGSLSNFGFEIQTPLLKGKNGEDAIKTACRILNGAGVSTNRETGLHIHLDGEGFMPENRTHTLPLSLVTLLLMYLTFEEVLLSFLPPSRRNNRYCELLRDAFHAKEIVDIGSLEQLERLWYRVKNHQALVERKAHKYDDSRYFGVNFHSFFKDGHLEIRYHSGTTNAKKILEWINLHQRIMDYCAQEGRFRSFKDARALTSLSERTEMLFELLSLSESSRVYFLGRQEMFASSRLDRDEASVNETTPCAA